MIKQEFPLLESVLIEDLKKGLSFSGKHLIPEQNLPLREIPILKYYGVNNKVFEIIEHNLRWANGEEKNPLFKFAYLSLPTKETPCNQKCPGCFTGNDKRNIPPWLIGEMYSNKTLGSIFNFLKEHGAESVIYSGGGELFSKKKFALDYIEKITNSGLGMMIFTNGTLLTRKDVEWISQRNISLTVSLRDTNEVDHNTAVGINGFRKSLRTLEYCLEEGMHKDNKLAVELPVTKENTDRVLYDFIPAMRFLEVIPYAEEYIQITTSPEEKRMCHDFSETREFFRKMAEIDEKFGYSHELIFGERMLAQGKCRRSLYSFVIYPRGDIVDCPSSSVNYGDMYKKSLKEIIYSDIFKDTLKNFQLCPCSTFYTSFDKDIPKNLPEHLEVFR